MTTLELFNKFWLLYPKKVGKGAARRVFLRLEPSEELTLKMIQAVKWQEKTDQWQKDNGQYIPHPSTWLHRESWDDEMFTKPVYKPKCVCGCGKDGQLKVSSDWFATVACRTKELGW